VREREREKEREREREKGRERERECVCVCLREREREERGVGGWITEGGGIFQGIIFLDFFFYVRWPAWWAMKRGALEENGTVKVNGGPYGRACTLLAPPAPSASVFVLVY
jgi:hypothetical protein